MSVSVIVIFDTDQKASPDSMDSVMERNRTRRRPRRQLGLEVPAKEHLAQQIASVVALSLQQNRRRGRYEGLSSSAGLLASTLRLAERNVADMKAYLQQREAGNTAMVARQVEVKPCCQREEDNVCVICLDGNMVSGEEEKVEALPCGHIFHNQCISQWLLYRRVCPVDRRPVD